MNKLHRKIYKYIDFELEHYQANKLELEELRQDIILSGSKSLDGQPRGSNISDTTASKADKLMTTASVAQKEKIIKIIDNVVKKLDKDYTKFFELNYKEQIGIVKVCLAMPIAERTYYNMKNKIIYLVAAELGYV